jgi:hypothetical protein
MLPGAGIGVRAGEFGMLYLMDGRPKSDKPEFVSELFIDVCVVAIKF